MARTVFTNANLFDGQSAPRSGMNVVLDGNRITSVSDQAPQTGGDDRVVDLGGKTLMPGMWQGHFHSGFGAFGGGTAAPVLGLEQPTAYYGMLAAKNASIALQCGFTSIVGSSNGQGLDVCLKEAVLAGDVQGPRVTACTHEFVVSGDAADGTNRSWFMGLQSHGLIRRCDGPEAFRQATREELGRGADIVKLSASPGHGAHPARDVCYMTDAELLAVTETAHDRGKLVRAHTASKASILACVRAGVDLIDHADRIDRECIDAILEADATVLPSMLWYDRFLGMAESWDHALQPFPIGDGFPEDLETTLTRIRGTRADFDYTREFLPEVVNAGVRLVVGDDFGTPLMPHGDYISEFEIYTKLVGIPALEVLKWTTKNGADAIGKGDSLGTIAEGKLADLLVIDGDPVADIACLRDPARMPAIVRDGVFVRDFLG